MKTLENVKKKASKAKRDNCNLQNVKKCEGTQKYGRHGLFYKFHSKYLANLKVSYFKNQVPHLKKLPK